jgi:hypothetical protein
MITSDCFGQSDGGFWTKTYVNFETSLMDSENDKSQATYLKLWYSPFKHYAVGPSVSYYNIENSTKGAFINYGIENIYFFSNDPLKLFVSLNAGAGTFNEDQNYSQGPEVLYNTGLYLNPDIGMIITTARGVGLKLGFGYHQQSLTIDYPEAWGWIRDTNLKIKRLKFSVGVVF